MDCGSCRYFVKWKSDSIGGGLCEYHDWRTKSDYGKKCKDAKPIPYKRELSNHKIDSTLADHPRL